MVLRETPNALAAADKLPLCSRNICAMALSVTSCRLWLSSFNSLAAGSAGAPTQGMMGVAIGAAGRGVIDGDVRHTDSGRMEIHAHAPAYGRQAGMWWTVEMWRRATGRTLCTPRASTHMSRVA